MKAISILLLGLALTGCGTIPTPDEEPADFKAVVTHWKVGVATVQCMLSNPSPNSGLWDSLSVKDARSGDALAFSIEQKTENMLSSSSTVVEDSYSPFNITKTKKGTAECYISTALLQVIGISNDSQVRISISANGKTFEKEISQQSVPGYPPQSVGSPEP